MCTYFDLNHINVCVNEWAHKSLSPRASFINPPTVDLMFSVLVPAPRHLTLERQLNKSVLIGWSIPEPPQCHQIESYHVYVDGVLKVTVKANERTRALVEGVDSNRVSTVYRT